MLIDFMERNPHLARNEQGGPNSFSIKEKKWSELAGTLNQRGPANKSVNQWKAVIESLPAWLDTVSSIIHNYDF